MRGWSLLDRSSQRFLDSIHRDTFLRSSAWRNANSILYSIIRLVECISLRILQGPPGTGKTSTVVAMIAALQATLRPPATAFAKPATALSKPDRLTIRVTGPEIDKTAPIARILVCAQSNAAIDELIMRLADPGIVGQDGRYR